MSTMVPGRGPMDAEICVVGEAPGRQEEAQGLPFVGPSGRLQDSWIRGAGLDPGLIRFENVCPFLPPGGHIEAVPWEELRQWQEDLRARLDDLTHARVVVATGNTALSALIDCTVSQAKITQRRGSVYLWSQASGRQVKVIPIIHPAAVLREEGERSQEDGLKTKKNYEARCRADWFKVAREVKTGVENIPPHRELRIQPSLEAWERMVGLLQAGGQPLAFDIETNPAQGKILCISFAADPYWAVSVPWSKGYKDGIRALLASDVPKITQNGHYDCYWLVQEGVVVHNWQWDTMAMSCLLWPNEPHSLAYLASVLTNEPWYKGTDEDTGEKRWAVNYDGEGTQDKWHALLDYNARDAAVTWECWAGLKQRLEEKGHGRTMQDGAGSMPRDVQQRRAGPVVIGDYRGMSDRDTATIDGAISHASRIQAPFSGDKGWLGVYQDQYQALLQPILDVMLHGMRVDGEELQDAFLSKIETAQAALAAAQRSAGAQLFTFDTQVQEACWKVALWEWDASDPAVAKKLKRAKGDEAKYVAQVEAKGISNQILASVLYDQMKLPTQRNRRTKSITTDEAALLKLRARYKDGGKYPDGMALIESVLQYREQKKQSEFLDPRRVDGDGRFRASYSFRPTTGRLASSSNPRGTGGNAQNIDRGLRGPFKPDPGCLLLEVDLSQAEARVVYCLTGNKKLIEMAHTRPSEFDCHTFMASEVFGFGPWDMTLLEGKKQKSDDRYLSKRVVHGGHYDLHPNKGSEVCLKDGYDISPKYFGLLQGKYWDFTEGAIQAWQQRTRMEVLRDRALTNAWGRTIEWPWDHFGDDLYRKAYAWRPQSDIARHLNRAWVRLDAELRRGEARSKVNLQLHDALIISVFPDEVWAVMSLLVEFCEEVHDYYGVSLRIPAEIKLGTAWGLGDIGEWKEMPTYGEVERAVSAYGM